MIYHYIVVENIPTETGAKIGLLEEEKGHFVSRLVLNTETFADVNIISKTYSCD